MLDGSRSPVGRSNFKGEGGPDLKYSYNPPCFVQKNGSTDRDAVWVMDWGGPKKACVRCGVDPHAKGQLLRERTCPGMPDDTLPLAV